MISAAVAPTVCRASRRSIPHIIPRYTNRSFSTSRRDAADHVRIVEVGARDGLQNEKKAISAADKIELLHRLSQTGVTHIEAGSFVPAKWVPQMAATGEILESLLVRPPLSPRPINYNYLVPNIRGMENMAKILEHHKAKHPSSSAATQQSSGYPTPPPSPVNEHEVSPAPNTSTFDPNAMPSSNHAQDLKDGPKNAVHQNLSEISLFAAATETFSQKNTNCSVATSLDRSLPIIELARQHQVRVRGYVSVALGCPYEGPDVDPHKVAELTASLLEMGCDEVSVADTTGMGTVPKTRRLLQTLKDAGIRMEDIALHFHDTYGQALVNTVIGLEHGVRVFDSSVGGLGGCPYSKGATGNVSTEDLIHLLHSLGVETGVDVVKMAETAEWICSVVGRGNEGRAGKATLARLRT